MGFFQRIANLWNGMLSLFVSDAEARNPAAVYEAAINERIIKHKELKKAVSGLVYLRNKTTQELETVEAELKEINAQLPVAVEAGEDDVALVLIEKRDELMTSQERLRGELDKVAAQAEEAKGGLMSFQAEIEKLRREKDEMLAAKASAEARIEIQESLSGLSTDADIQALDGVRSSINKLRAEADVGAEINDSSLDRKLQEIKKKSRSLGAKAELEEMKRQMAAKKSAAQQQGTEGGGGPGVKKTM